MVYHDLPLGWLTLCKPASMQITLRINTSELCENRWVRGSAASGYPGAPHVTHSEPAASFPAPATGQSGPAFVAHLLSAASAPNCHLVIKRAPPG